jgi:hypothetical protein
MILLDGIEASVSRALSSPLDDRPAKRDIHVIFEDSDGNGGPRPCSLALERKRSKVEGRTAA